MSTSDPVALAPPSGEMVSVPAAQPTLGADASIPGESSPPSRRRGESLVKRQSARVKPPKDSRVYKVALAIIALKAQGVKMPEISEQLGYSQDVLRQYLSRANRKGWLNLDSFDSVDDQLEYVLKHKVARNVSEFLESRDKDVTLEAAKGLGMFKTHQVQKVEGGSTLGVALKVQVEMPPATGTSPVTIRPGTIGGARGTDIPIDAEVVEA